jgi:phage protein D
MMGTPPASTQPIATVKVNGQELPPAAVEDLLDLSVADHLEGPSMFTLRLSAWAGQRPDFGWADDELFTIGNQVEIQLGYSGTPATLIYADLNSVELELSAGEPPMVVVQGFDRRHRMARGNQTRTFVKMKDSDIVTFIAEKHGLTAHVEDSKVVHAHLNQRGSDLQFLSERARELGFELLLWGRELHFRKRQLDAPPKLALQPDLDLMEFSAKLSVSNQVTDVEVRGWDPKRKEVIIGKASSDRSSMGKQGAPQTTQQAFGKSTLSIKNVTLASQEEADRLAREQLERNAMDFGQASGSCRGRTDLRAGIIIELLNVGKRFSGKYYVTETNHTYGPTRGYQTSFSIRRNAT